MGNGSMPELDMEESNGMGSSSGDKRTPDIWPMLEVLGACELLGSISILSALVVISWWCWTVLFLLGCNPIIGLCYWLMVKWVSTMCMKKTDQVFMPFWFIFGWHWPGEWCERGGGDTDFITCSDWELVSPNCSTVLETGVGKQFDSRWPLVLWTVLFCDQKEWKICPLLVQ